VDAQKGFRMRLAQHCGGIFSSQKSAPASKIEVPVESYMVVLLVVLLVVPIFFFFF
jgi:hypothetical protein